MVQKTKYTDLILYGSLVLVSIIDTIALILSDLLGAIFLILTIIWLIIFFQIRNAEAYSSMSKLYNKR